MPSFTTRHYTPDRFHSLTKDDVTDDAIPSPNPSLGQRPSKSHHTSHHGLYPSSLALIPSDNGSLLDYFDLPSPPSTPHRASHTHSSLSYSVLSGYPSPASTRLPTPSLCSSSRRSSMSSAASSADSSPAGSPPMSSPPRWPTASQRIHRLRPRSRSTSSTSSTSSSSSSSTMDVEMAGTETDTATTTTTTTGLGMTYDGVVVRPARRTPYYPPNASRNSDRTRVYMNRGPHFVQNWTPMGSLPRHVQLRIEEGMVRFTA